MIVGFKRDYNVAKYVSLFRSFETFDQLNYHRILFIGRHTYTWVVLLTFSPVKYTMKMIIKFNKLYTKLKIRNYLIISCRPINYYLYHHGLRDL